MSAYWRNLPPTEKQLDCIAAMEEFSEFPIPLFTGTTRGEASDYIDEYGEIAHTRVDKFFGY